MGIRWFRKGPGRYAPAVFALAAATAMSAAADEIALDANDWRFTSETGSVTTYKGAPALSLYNATAWLKGLRFRDGTIEFKVAFPRDRGFVGVRFRARDDENYEHFYLRPHQSGNPDANQYTPVFHGIAGWQIYYGPRYSVPVTYPYGTWIKVKLVVSGDKADVYINSEKPVLHIADLKRDAQEGFIGFGSFLTHAFISELRVTQADSPRLTGKAAALPELPKHLIETWRVSNPVPAIEPGAANLSATMKTANWQTLAVESNGIANLARIGPTGEERNTILARISVHAEKSVTKPLHFGFSDKVTAFVNGTPVYRGDDTYRSRDYRFLGTVGRFDTLFLPLKEGPNEIIFAVEEGFGGWALTAAFKDMAGIRIVPDN